MLSGALRMVLSYAISRWGVSGADEMASAEELYARWLESAPTEAGVGDVEKVLERYLPGRWRRGTKHQ